MEVNLKKISLIIINYNDDVRIGRAIDCCLEQTYKDVEVIVVDDGSNEKTRKEYLRYGDKIKLVQLERKDAHERNPSRPRNKGIEIATGEYIAFLDSDNFWSRDFCECMLKDIKDVAFCDWEIFGKQSYKVNIEKVWDFKKDVMTNYISSTHLDHQCIVVKTDIVKEIGCYDERLARSQDCDFLIRLMKRCNNWNYIDKFLFHFEKHEEDQMKTVASIYGKTLWFLKNDLNIAVLMNGYARDYNTALSVHRAIYDFENSPIWEKDYNKSEFKKQYFIHEDILNKEWTE